MTTILLHFSQTCEFWSSKANWRLRFSLQSIIFNRFKRSRFVICDWWISIRFVCFCVSRFVVCDRNYDWRQRKRNCEGGFWTLEFACLWKAQQTYWKTVWRISSIQLTFSSTGPPDTIADGLRTSVGHLTWPIIRDNLTDVITVTEEEIISAMRLVWERMKLLIEPSAAVGVAAVLTEKFQEIPEQDLKNVAVILCGGNVDLDNLPWKK